MRTIKDVPLSTRGRILRVERRADHRGESKVVLHVISPQVRRGPSDGPIHWYPPSVLLPLISALENRATATIPLGGEKRLVLTWLTTTGLDCAHLSIDVPTEKRGSSEGPILVPAAAIPALVEALRIAAMSFGLEA